MSKRPDYVEVYLDDAAEWRWRRKDGDNHKVLSDSGEGYENAAWALEQAVTLNPGCSVVRFEHEVGEAE